MRWDKVANLRGLNLAPELMGLQSLPIAVGVDLPISTSAPMFVGGAIRWLVERRLRGGSRSMAEVESGPGVLFSSGLIAGGAIAGIVIAGIAAALVMRADAAGVPAAEYLAHAVGLQQALGGFATSNLVALAMFGLMGAVLYRVAQRECLPPLRLHPVITGPDGYVYFCTNNRDGRGSPISTDDRIVRLVPVQ